METTAIVSTFVMTLLMMVGLFFFIRASVKDRTESVTLLSEQAEASLLDQLKQYFAQRAYRVVAINADQNEVTFEGFVRPSLFLAVFLSILAALGTLCLALVLVMLFSGIPYPFVLVLVSPLAGIFYWKKAGRMEKVALKINEPSTESSKLGTLIQVTAHRDEVSELQRLLSLELVEQH
ncbi:MAG: cofactor assembly of complex C subunit B [Leptolyngbyaceae cyanobacterium bins.59]|nr:cofactor assembly of complex C subunit B [Leptolyngbyaceae cyanobacterium bins.59]